MKTIETTYGRNDIPVTKLELDTLEITKTHVAVTVRFNGNNTHRTVKSYPMSHAKVLIDQIAKVAKRSDFPWEDQRGERMWKKLPGDVPVSF